MPPDPQAAARYAEMATEQARRQADQPAVVVGGEMGAGAAALPGGHFQVYTPGRGQEGYAYRDDKGRVSLKDPQGDHHMILEAEAQAHVDKGWSPVDVADHHAQMDAKRIERSADQAFLGSFVSGVSGGGSDVLLEQHYGGRAARKEGELREAHPTASAIGEVTGAVAGFAAGGSALGVGKAARSAAGLALKRGFAEGALYAGGRELSSQALAGGEYDVEKIAREAVYGAAVGSLISLGGIGVASVAGKAAKRVKNAIHRVSGVDTPRLDALLAQQRTISGRLKFSTGLQEDALRTAKRAGDKAIRAERVKVFTAAGTLLNKVRLPLGIAPLTYGFSLPNLLLGAAAQGVPRLLQTRLVSGVGVALTSGTARGLKAAMPFMGKVTGVALLEHLTDNDMEALSAQLEITTAEEVGLAAAEGYHLSGMDPAMAGYLADFQRKRVELLHQVIQRRPDAMGRLVASRVMNAVEDPRRIMARLTQGEVWGEDLLVLQYLFPEVYTDLQRQSQALLERPGLTGRQRVDLMKMAGDERLVTATNAVQTAMQPQPDAGQGGRRFNPARDTQTETQRLQGGTK